MNTNELRGIDWFKHHTSKKRRTVDIIIGDSTRTFWVRPLTTQDLINAENDIKGEDDFSPDWKYARQLNLVIAMIEEEDGSPVFTKGDFVHLRDMPRSAIEPLIMAAQGMFMQDIDTAKKN